MAATRSALLPVILVVAVLAVAGGAWMLLSEDSGPGNVVRVAEDTQVATDEVYDAAVDDVTANRQVESLAAPVGAGSGSTDASRESFARLAGRAVSATDGRPLVGLALSGSFQPPRLDEAASTLVTDEDGAFEFALTSDATALWIEIEAGPRTPRHRHREKLALLAGETLDVELRVPDGGLLSGRVEDESGRPLPDVTVQGWSGSRWSLADEPDRIFVTDGTGRWELPALGPSFVLSAAAEGLVPSYRLHGKVGDGEHKQDVVLRLEPAVPLQGRVVDAFEQPVEGASIRTRSNVPESPTEIDGIYRMDRDQLHATSDAQGGFQIEATSAREWQVWVVKQDQAQWEGHHDPSTGPLLVRLTRGATLSGTVFSTAGTPLPAAEVFLESASYEARNEARVQTDEAGRYTIDNMLPENQAIVSAMASGHAVDVKQPITLSAQGENRLDFVLSAERVLAGVVVDTAGRPVAGAELEIEGDRIVRYGAGARLPKPTWERRHRLARQTSDEHGRFRFGNLYPGRFEIKATASDDADLVAVLTAASGTTDLRLVLDPDAAIGVTFRGIARDALTLQPIEVFDVTPMVAGANGGMAGYNQQFEDPTGAFRITGLDSALILIRAQAEGYAVWTLEPKVYEPGVYDVEIFFLPRRTAVFEVVDSHAAPVPGARLTFRDQAGARLDVELSASSSAGSISVDDQGSARAAGLPADLITVSVFRYDLRQTVEFPVDLRSEPLGPITLRMPDPGEVQVPVHVLTAGLLAPSPQVSTGIATYEDDLASGLVRTIGAPVEIVVVDANGQEVSRGRVEPADTTEPAIHDPGHGVLGRWTPVPWKQEMTMTVTAPGFAPSQLAGCVGCLDDSGVPALFVILIPE